MDLRSGKVISKNSNPDSSPENSEQNLESTNLEQDINSNNSDSDSSSSSSSTNTLTSEHNYKLSLSADFLGFANQPVTPNSSFSILTPILNVTTMATIEEKKSFISTCASIMRDNYSGDPLALGSFINKVELMEVFSNEDLTPNFIAFLKSKLEGKAREALPTHIESVSQIKEALCSEIRPDNSKVVAGKIAALRVTNNNFSEFSKQVEELSDSLERCLIIEGMTKAKAHEMAVEQTISVCRLNSRSDMVKSILASTTFKDSKDVVAKMIIEREQEIKERQVLAFRSHPIRYSNFRGNSRGNSNFRYNNNSNFRFNGNANRQHTNTNFRNNNYNRGNNHNYNRGYNRNYNRGNSNSNNNNNNRSGNNRNSNSQGSNSRNSANVRSLNAEAPQARTLREQEQFD
ncbi:GATA zinc finger domain-containing protein 14-like [Eurosta solidaginis]|uniref:GATA zinc finger domain-containing protein 14-like n=1 Tax=Eurosta solidaginis TaxID=178769 RepID=UPI0035314226